MACESPVLVIRLEPTFNSTLQDQPGIPGCPEKFENAERNIKNHKAKSFQRITHTSQRTRTQKHPLDTVDQDVKAYFRTVDEQIQSWQENQAQPEDEDADLDPNEGVHFCQSIEF
ncbi:hypothetical protein JVU11DRAFT_1325 [Chiua virens]|nr:hypothetical protein JVU11DRAFT_1325 [Chiua virens]